MGLIGVYGFYIQSVAEQFNRSIAVVNSGLAVLLLVSAILSPTLGRLIDKTSLKPVIVLGGTLTAGGLVLMSFAQQFSQLVLGFVVLSAGIVLYGPLVGNLLLVRAYRQHRARAMAIAAAGVSIAAILLPVLVGQLLGAMSWQVSLRVLAVLVMIGVPATAMALVREPDRQDEAQADGQQGQDSTAIFRNRNFWILGLTMAIVMSLMSLLAVILVPHFLSLGFDHSEAALALASMGVTGLLGKLSLATASDRIRPFVKYLVIGIVITQALVWGVLSISTAFGVGFVAALVLGFCNGTLIPLLPYINSVYFAEDILGRVNGIHMAMMLPFSLVGPWLAGRHFDINGSYLGVFVIFASILLGLALLLAFLPKPTSQNVCK